MGGCIVPVLLGPSSKELGPKFSTKAKLGLQARGAGSLHSGLGRRSSGRRLLYVLSRRPQTPWNRHR